MTKFVTSGDTVRIGDISIKIPYLDEPMLSEQEKELLQQHKVDYSLGAELDTTVDFLNLI